MSNKTNLIVDLGIFAAFLAAANPRLTGISIHEWLSVALAGAVIAHLLLHWKWIVQITVQYFKKLFHRSRLNYIVDLLFFAAMTGVMFSGLAISKSVLPALGIQVGEAGRSLRMLHSLTADASVILLGIHFALHLKWVLSHLDRYAWAPLRGLLRRPTPRTAAVQPVRIDDER